MLKRRAWLRSLPAVMCCAPALARAADSASMRLSIAHRRYQLANGLDVVVHVDGRQPLVALDLSYGVGSMHDGANPGLAHLVEHLMFRGTETTDDGEFRSRMSRSGAIANARTSRAYTSYHCVLPANQLPLALWLESDRMAHTAAVVTEGKLREEIKTTSDEWVFRLQSQAFGDSIAALHELFFPPGHPFQLAPPERIAGLALDPVREFMARYHGPQNATLVVAGDVPNDIDALLEHHFGHRRGGDTPAPLDYGSQQASEQRLVREDRLAQTPLVVTMWRTSARFEGHDATADVFATVLDDEMEMLIAQLDGPELGRYGVHQVSHVGASLFSVRVEGVPGTTPEALLGLVDEIFARLRKQALPEHLIERARMVLTLSRLREVETYAGRTRLVQGYVQAGKSPDWFNQDVDRYAQVDAQSILDLLNQVLVPERRAVLLAHPAPAPVPAPPTAPGPAR